MRETYIIDRETNTVMLKSEWLKKQTANPASAIILKDITPYHNMVDGKLISSRSEHKAFLKQHGLIEVGNEKIRPKKPEPMPDIRMDMARAIDRLKNR